MAAKVVLVTGGASGIGYAAAEAWCRQGCRVVISDRDQTAGDRAAARLTALGGEARFIACDVADAPQCTALMRQIETDLGGLDVAFNNAGIAGPSARIADCAANEWRQTIDVNLYGVFNCLREELRLFTTCGGGVAVNMSSIYGKRGIAGGSAYSASKHAVIGLTKSAALEYASRGVRVNAVCPGFVDTALTRGESSTIAQDTLRARVARGGMKRYATVDEIVQTVVWLASDAATFVNGAAIDIDGGFLAA